MARAIWPFTCPSITVVSKKDGVKGSGIGKVMIRIEGLLLTSDAQVLSVMNEVLDNFEIETEICNEPEAALDVVSHRKLDTLIVDWNGGDQPARVLNALRQSHQNAKSTAVVIVSGAPEVQAAARAGANFMIYKPMNVDQATHCLRAAYGNILLQRRRSARYPVEIPVLANVVGHGAVEGTMIDISAGGLAFLSRQPLQTDQQISLEFTLPEVYAVIHLVGRVVDVAKKDGKTRVGICFSFVPKREFALLEEWLAAQAEKVRQPFAPADCNNTVN